MRTGQKCLGYIFEQPFSRLLLSKEMSRLWFSALRIPILYSFTMSNYAEEQKDELEALESIYPDSFTVISTDPHSFTINVATEESNTYEECEPLSTTLQFTYTQAYPEEAPLFEILETIGLLDDNSEDKIVDFINQQIEENLGMVMIFTIVSAVQEFLNQCKDDKIQRAKDEEERKERELKEAEEKKCHGTPVNVATFLAWKKKFEAEMEQLERERMQNEKKCKKLTGKEIFLQMKSIGDDAELLDGETEAVEVDESLFEDIDDLELEDELDIS